MSPKKVYFCFDDTKLLLTSGLVLILEDKGGLRWDER